MGKARDFRLMSDYKKIEDFTNKNEYVELLDVQGIPPTEYLFQYNINGYLNAAGSTASSHKVKLTFPENYPLGAPPKLTVINGLFHPNIYRSGDVCHGWSLTNWSPAIRVDDILFDLARIIAFKTDAFNLSSPANAFCSLEWMQNHNLPADSIELTAREAGNSLASFSKVESKSPNPSLPNNGSSNNKKIIEVIQSATGGWELNR